MEFLLNFYNLHKIYHVLKKNQLYSLHISEVIDSEKCGYLNTRMHLL